MAWEAWLTLSVVVGCFATMALTRISPAIIMSGGLTLLLVSGVLLPEQALAGFANQGMLTVAVLYIVVSGLTETGAVGWIVQHILGRPHTLFQAQARLMAPAAILSAFLNNTPVVAVFLPAVKVWARRNNLKLSRLLIPLSYASIVGGTCTLIGTSTNLVVNGLLLDQVGSPGLGMFDLAWIGLPITVSTLLFVLLFSGKLLPEREEPLVHGDNIREYTTEMMVEEGSPLEGCSIEKAGLRALHGLFLAEIERDGVVMPAVDPYERLEANDRLMFVGAIESVVDLHGIRGLAPATNQVLKLEGDRKDRSFFEAVVSNTCPLIGKSVREGRFRTHYHAVIIALARNGARQRGKIGDMVLRTGDTLLLEARPNFIDQQGRSRDFLLVSEVGGFHPPNHKGAPIALAVTMAMVVLAASGLMSMLEASLVAAGLMIATGCTSARVARQAPDGQVLLVIATSFGVGAALQSSGVAAMLADGIIGLAGGDPWATLALVFTATALLTAIATNNVAAVLSFPIALSAAQHMNVDIMPFAIAIMVAASASFATPIGYQTNLMVYNAGGYQFADFVRIGVPLTLLVGLVTVGLVPLIWGF
ncbi:SLC13 family permease [Gammaproteobacteria bacterium]|nr:SLC13 family permease [Gammaproteobacteria bacterium]